MIDDPKNIIDLNKALRRPISDIAEMMKEMGFEVDLEEELRKLFEEENEDLE